eukprot:1149820-Pelagomonas_calceolata.AAC.2
MQATRKIGDARACVGAESNPKARPLVSASGRHQCCKQMETRQALRLTTTSVGGLAQHAS